VKKFDAGTTGRDVAESISKSLAKKAVAVALDGDLRDLADPVAPTARSRSSPATDPRALELIRHDARM
jgi:threonyl-tRNA synthetase